ncbi:MDR family MFS transporter [Alkalihalobacillus sp. LMS39]|uniref:MDR family MFS transporter n=1 Tax=Alkalihalobacillus sp. LMS39 TaxID=2924032 RepID=UPI001FB3300F|nr:MDR family MFS transporter [Alkalihalobacillus sp. LMS39]UOE94318.1 MFS transporter [Alkalihalobacillus sp. LMS39]
MEHLDMKQKITIMIAVMSVMLFAALNMTIVGTSLPKIIADIGGMEYFNWVFMIYMLTSSITAILVGKLSDLYGRKLFILVGIIIFILGSLLCGFSTSISQLITFRGLQGFGGGMIMSTAMTTVGDLFSPRERGRWQGLMTGVFGVSSLFGPTLGGVIVDNMNWSWVFWIFLPVGMIAFFMILKLYPQSERKQKEKIDFVGSIVLSGFILTVLLGFSWAGTQFDWISFEIIGLFSVAIVLLCLFIFIEGKVKSPVVPLHLFGNRIVSISNIVSFLSGAGMFGIIMYAPFYVQGVLGRSATTSGLVEMVMTIALVICSALAGQLITKTGKYKNLALLGFLIMAVGFFLNATLKPDSSLLLMVIYLVITGIGLGLTMPIFTLTVQNAVAHKYLGVATATSQLSRQMGGTIGVAVLGTVMSSRLAKQMENVPVAGLPAGAAEISAEVLMDQEMVEQIKMTIPEQAYAGFEHYLLMLREALSYGLTGVFIVCGIVIVAAFGMTLPLKEIPLRQTNEEHVTEENIRQE